MIEELVQPFWNYRSITEPEWILFSSESQELRICRAEDQREAVKEALRRGMYLGDTHDVRPRVASEELELMSNQDFFDYIDSLTA